MGSSRSSHGRGHCTPSSRPIGAAAVCMRIAGRALMWGRIVGMCRAMWSGVQRERAGQSAALSRERITTGKSVAIASSVGLKASPRAAAARSAAARSSGPSALTGREPASVSGAEPSGGLRNALSTRGSALPPTGTRIRGSGSRQDHSSAAGGNRAAQPPRPPTD